MKVAIYLRVSTDDKDQDPIVFLDACRNYCKLHNHLIVREIQDEGVSGDTWYYDRKGGKELEQLINRHSIDGIVCFSMDRFSRQSPLKILPLLEQLKSRGILFISVTEPIFNMDSEFAPMIQYMLAWFNNWFLIQHKKKVNAGMEKARIHGTRSGKAIGKPRKADYVQIVERYMVLKSISQVAKELNISKSSVSNAIKKKVS